MAVTLLNAVSEDGQQLDVGAAHGRKTVVEGDHAHAASAGERQQMPVGNLTVSRYGREIGVRRRYVVNHELVRR